MPSVETRWIKNGVLGVTNFQTIKNVQPQAIAILGSPDKIQFRRLEYGSEFEAYAQFKENIRDAFISFMSVHDDKNITKLVDSEVYDGYLSEVFDSMSEKAISLVKDGSLYSDVLKEHLVKEHDELTEDMLKKQPKATTAKAVKAPIDVSSLDIDIDDL